MGFLAACENVTCVPKASPIAGHEVHNLRGHSHAPARDSTRSGVREFTRGKARRFSDSAARRQAEFEPHIIEGLPIQYTIG